MWMSRWKHVTVHQLWMEVKVMIWGLLGYVIRCDTAVVNIFWLEVM